MMKSLLVSLAFVLLSSLSCAVSAQPDALYQVEVIVFENRQLTQADIEKWPSNPALPELSSAKNLTKTEELKLIPYELLPSSQLNLTKEADNIARDPNYNVLLHLSWLQPLNDDQLAPVHLYSQDNFADIHQLQPYDASKKWKLDGVIAIKKRQYFEINADLILNKIKPDSDAHYGQEDTTAKPLVYRLKQNRRMRESELHYIDNPVFGVLIKITPSTKLTEAAETTPSLATVEPESPVN